MKTINSYINESYIMPIDEKLSIGDAIFKFINKTIFRIDTKTQSEVVKMISKFVEEHSNDQVKTHIMRLKELDSKLNNCINKDDNFWYSENKTVGEAITAREYWKNLDLVDDTPFICFYNKDNKTKFYVWIDSPVFLTAKDKKGRRPLMGWPELDPNNDLSYGKVLIDDIIPRVIDDEKWQQEQKEKKAKQKEEDKKNAMKRIEAIEKELEELKNIVKDK